ncbi:MAG TPA: thiamine pyrophosphate-binding protein [Rhizomicrobium sp.]|nr:thiamine pyrophosphate-binding protein [Rhizomicrobium sp.]
MLVNAQVLNAPESKIKKVRDVHGADVVVDAFLRNRTERIFIFPGGTIGPILDRIEKRTKIEIVCPRTEQGAGYAALGYARLTGKPAVFMVTSGPGVTNAVTPIADAYYDNIPMVVITGQVGTGDMRGNLPVKQRGFQEVDTVDLMRPVTKKAILVKDLRDLPDVMEEAFFLARTGRQGPVVIDLPMNVQRGTLAEDQFRAIEDRRADVPVPDADKINTLAQWIGEAQRPVILAGGGVIASGAWKELCALVDRYRIPVAMSMPGMGAYPSGGAMSLGLCGYAGSQWANLAIYKSDLLIGIGTTFHLRQTGSLPDRTVEEGRIARIDLDANELRHSRVPLDLDINADARLALASLGAVLKRTLKPAAAHNAAWLKTIAGWKAQHPLWIGKASRLPKPQDVIEAVNALVKGEQVLVTTGVGQHQVWVPRHFDFAMPERVLLTSSGHGTMGYDVPTAVGAKIAMPDATVVCFVGDGSFQMNIQELATIAERKLDIKIVVLDNHSLNIVAQFQRQNWKSHPTTGDKYNPDFAAIAKAYGVDSVAIKTKTGMKEKLRAALRWKGPVVIHCHVDPEEDLLPMLLGGHTLDDMSTEWSF